jgi:hypothetical protein
VPLVLTDPSGETVLIWGWEGFGTTTKASQAVIKDIYEPIAREALGAGNMEFTIDQQLIFPVKDKQKVAEDIIKRAKELDFNCCHPRIVLIGYSWGAVLPQLKMEPDSGRVSTT